MAERGPFPRDRYVIALANFILRFASPWYRARIQAAIPYAYKQAAREIEERLR